MEKTRFIPPGIVQPEIRTLLSSEIEESFKKGISKYGDKARKNLEVLLGGDLARSNCFTPVELIKHLPKKMRLSTMADLGAAIDQKPGFFEKYSSDLGLVLVTAGDSHEPNNYLAENLAKQLYRRKMPLKEGVPMIIPFSSLVLEESDDSTYGLSYKLRRGLKLGKDIIVAPQITNNYLFNYFDEVGIPIESSRGKKPFSGTRREGLARYRLHRCGDVSANIYDLSDVLESSNAVVVVDEDPKETEEKIPVYSEVSDNIKVVKDCLTELGEKFVR